MKKADIVPFLGALSQRFSDEIKNIPGMKKKTREDLEAGFRDGARSAVMALQHTGDLKVEE